MPRTEAKTREDLIDPALAQAGWDVHNPGQVGAEHYSKRCCIGRFGEGHESEENMKSNE
jgi:predicted type IV restriction endonuclease